MSEPDPKGTIQIESTWNGERRTLSVQQAAQPTPVQSPEAAAAPDAWLGEAIDELRRLRDYSEELTKTNSGGYAAGLADAYDRAIKLLSGKAKPISPGEPAQPQDK